MGFGILGFRVLEVKRFRLQGLGLRCSGTVESQSTESHQVTAQSHKAMIGIEKTEADSVSID